MTCLSVIDHIIDLHMYKQLLNTENADSIFFPPHRFGARSSAAPLCAAYSAYPLFALLAL